MKVLHVVFNISAGHFVTQDFEIGYMKSVETQTICIVMPLLLISLMPLILWLWLLSK